MEKFLLISVIVLILIAGPVQAQKPEPVYKSKLMPTVSDFGVALKNKENYISSERFSDLAKGETTSLYIANDCETKIVYIDSISVNATGESHLTIYDSFTVQDSGTQLERKNLFLGQATPPSCIETYRDGSFSVDTESYLLDVVVPGGSTSPVRSIGGSLDVRFVVLPPGEKLVTLVENVGGNDEDVSITIVWTEYKISQ